MKKLILLSIALLFLQQTISACDCAVLESYFYRFVSQIVRNDYLSLVHYNSTWLLKNKLQSQRTGNKEHDHYFLRHIHILKNDAEEDSIGILYTPLHEAVDRGNPATVKLLREHGSDKNKVIKISQELVEGELAIECSDQSVSWDVVEVAPENMLTKGKELRVKSVVGLTAVALAKKLLEQERDHSKRLKRQEICRLLED